MESLDYIRHKFQEHLPEGKVVNDHFISARFKKVRFLLLFINVFLLLFIFKIKINKLMKLKDVKYSFEEVHQMLVAQNRDAIERARRQIQKRMR